MAKSKQAEPKQTEPQAIKGELASFPTTGDSLAKPDYNTINQPAPGPTGGFAGTSIIAHMPKAQIADGAEEAKISKSDYEGAMQEIVLTMAKHFLLTTPDVFAHSKIRAAVNLIEAYDDEQATINQTTATGGGVPVSQTSTGTVDADPIPVSSTTTTDPTVQPADPVTPDPVTTVAE